jgi:hypothetical protein
MYNLLKTIFIFTIYLVCCPSSHSQTNTRIAQTDYYCDSVDNVTAIQTIRKTGVGVTLDYIISNGEVIKIIEQPAGYKFISAKETYYFQNNKSVYVSADIEISSEDGGMLTIELHKIYLDNNHIIKHLAYEQTFDADSLYNNNPDPVRTSENIRKKAELKTVGTDRKFEKSLLQTIDKYLDAGSKKEGDPLFEELYSPFI